MTSDSVYIADPWDKSGDLGLKVSNLDELNNGKTKHQNVKIP